MSMNLNSQNNNLILLSIIILFVMHACYAQTGVINVADNGWRLFPDTSAQWKNDNIYLPGEFDLNKLSVNPPTGGWNVLNNMTGISVTLPATVEEYYWGKFGFRPYKNAYYFEDDDNQVKNGNYLVFPGGGSGLRFLKVSKIKRLYFISGELVSELKYM